LCLYYCVQRHIFSDSFVVLVPPPPLYCGTLLFFFLAYCAPDFAFFSADRICSHGSLRFFLFGFFSRSFLCLREHSIRKTCVFVFDYAGGRGPPTTVAISHGDIDGVCVPPRLFFGFAGPFFLFFFLSFGHFIMVAFVCIFFPPVFFLHRAAVIGVPVCVISGEGGCLGILGVFWGLAAVSIFCTACCILLLFFFYILGRCFFLVLTFLFFFSWCFWPLCFWSLMASFMVSFYFFFFFLRAYTAGFCLVFLFFSPFASIWHE